MFLLLTSWHPIKSPTTQRWISTQKWETLTKGLTEEYCFFFVPTQPFLSNQCLQINIIVSWCLLSKSVVSHTQASSKNGLFHLTQVITTQGAAAVQPDQPYSLPLFLSVCINYEKRMDKSAGLLNLKHKPSLALPCCHLYPSLPLSSWLGFNLVAVDVIFPCWVNGSFSY